ncbi:MAG: hypothetical protein M3Y18_01405 [Candidatus Eremiobacteraeota bacterium]|nr:hypothetical protein [Candidatus Eremiobacteraeota bacterium]
MSDDPKAQSERLDAAIAAVIEGWHADGCELTDPAFSELALRIFHHQLVANEPYARYCSTLGITRDRLPDRWDAIPALPSGAYKESVLATFDAKCAELVFETSGTTRGAGGRHYMETAALYDSALLAGFDRFVLADDARLGYANLVPNPIEHPHSSLGYMMAHVAARRGTSRTGWFLRNGELQVAALLGYLHGAQDAREPICIAATAFALAAAIDACRERGERFELAKGSRIMETGGFKGRAVAIDRETLYRDASDVFGIPGSAIIAEYGMTELTSQYYDLPSSRSSPVRVKVGPPWLRHRIIGPDGAAVPRGTVGALAHVDLANRSSCIAIATEDLGVAVPGGFVLLGRDANAELRGCSLDAESLLAAARA